MDREAEHLPELATLAEKIEYLFEHYHPGKDRPFTMPEVVARARDLGGPTISLGFLHSLRTGKSVNPTVQHLQALAGAFNIPLSYFIEDKIAEDLASQLKLIALIQERGVTSIALRAADLHPAARETLLAVIDALERQAASKTETNTRGDL